jgi:MFS family permease
VRATLNTTFRSLAVRNYRLFATGQLVKLIGVWMMFTAQDWLVLDLSGNSGSALGIVTALQFLPVLLLTLYAGKLADRYDKRRILIGANAAYAVLAVVFAILVASGAVELWHVFVFAGLLGTANAIETPVRQSFVSELVGMTLLPNALSLSAATFNIARVSGPALAGLAIATLGIGPVFLISTALAVSPVFSYLRMNVGALIRTGLTTGKNAKGSVLDGLRYVWTRADLLLVIVVMAVVAMIGFNFPVTLAVLAKVSFGAGAASFGLLTTALALGALGGALAGSARTARPSIYSVLLPGVAFAAFEVLVGFAPTFWAAALLLVPTGFFMIFFAQAANQRVQLGTDAAYRGRVMALYVLVFLGTTPIGAPLAGWWSELFGPAVSIALSGAVSLVAALAALAWQLRRSGERLRLTWRPIPRLSVVAPPEPNVTIA